jgi:hypothetical protein
MILQRHRLLVISTVRLTAVAAALLMLTMLVVTRSQAAFSDTTDNTANSFSTGSVVLDDDDGGSSALFTAAAMTPGVPVVNCITLTYSGTLTPADVRMYATASGALATYMDATIEVGTGGSFGSCGGFVAGSTIYTGTLANLAATRTDWASGEPTFTAASNPTSRTLRFTFDVQNVPAAQSSSATATFTWEARD